LFHREFLSSVRQAGDTYARLLLGHAVTFAAFKQSPWHHYGILALEQTQVCMRSPFLDNDLVQTMFRAPVSARASDKPSLRLIADGNGDLARIPTDRGVGGNCGPLFGAASRGAFEFLFKAEYAYDMGMPQWVARIDHLLSPLRLERLFLGRHKVFHFRLWYRDTLANYLKEILLDPLSLSRPYIERKGIETMVLGHVKGDRNYTNDIHKILTLELLHRLLIDRSSGFQNAPRSLRSQLVVTELQH
jgi:asparagine synthase (glutamine-hydrolysing)